MTIEQEQLLGNQPEYLDQQFHLMLLVARLLVQYSAATERVYRAIDGLAAKFRLEARLFVDYKAITLTTKNGNEFASRFSKSIPVMSINMAVITQIFRLLEQIKQGQKSLEQALEELEKIAKISASYSRFLVVLMLAIAAGSLARIFQGDWQTCLITGVATAFGTIVRQELAARKFNLFLITFIVAFAGGIISGVAIQLNWTTTSAICLLVPSMMLVPGVHLINGILDLVENHILVGIARLGLSLSSS
ncbi:threonine/serine ThrE exporter family protein [Gloeothece verrucosa]|uniref:threonine/serine ThrE exporter family protein n=1 Tax=Gloeothece verrucosa TaxID=2546359 RepID=UPI000308CDA1|nr:threonine/serine exporter family protein [Gloeothece verrucosa]